MSIDIPGFIRRIDDKDNRGAYDVITAANLLPAICGRVCPQENQCEGVCTWSARPSSRWRSGASSASSAIARSAEGWSSAPFVEPPDCASASSDRGLPAWRAPPTWPKPAATSRCSRRSTSPVACCKYGIPDFRLPNPVIDAEIDNLRKLGVKFECNTLVGRLFTIDEMIDEMGFHAVFIGTGAGYPSMMGIPGESLNGVLSANELLTRCNLMRAREFPEFDTPLPIGKKVAVVGSGNTAMDALRVTPAARRRESALHLPPHQGREPGARRRDASRRRGRHRVPLAHQPRGDPRRRHGQRARDALHPHGARRARRVRPPPSVPVTGSEFEFPIDIVVFAIGTNANPIIGQTSS